MFNIIDNTITQRPEATIRRTGGNLNDQWARKNPRNSKPVFQGSLYVPFQVSEVPPEPELPTILIRGYDSGSSVTI